jgi:hypothetical protein
MSEQQGFNVPQLSIEQQLRLERFRRQLEDCDDVVKLREYCMGAIRMNMMRGNMFNEIMKQGFTR